MINQYEVLITDNMKKAIQDYMNSGGWLTEYKVTEKFADMIKKYTGAKYCSITTSGTVALFLGMTAMSSIFKLPPKRYIAVPDYTMIASANSSVLAGYMPVLFDVEKESFCLSTDKYNSFLKSCQAIMLVSINGRYPKCVEEILEISRDYHIPIIEDSAQSFGSFYKNKHIGTYGELGIFSFSTPKIITTGNGGAIVTNNKALYERIELLKDFGRTDPPKNIHSYLGYNFKFTDLQASVGVAQMNELKDRIKMKENIFKTYQDLLSGIKQVKIPDTNLKQTTPWFMDMIVEKRDELVDYLLKHNIKSRGFYPPIHTQMPYVELSKQEGFEDYNSNYVSANGLHPPSGFKLEESQIHCICDCIKEFYERN